MNGQNRSSTDYEQINPVKKVETLENYRDYKRILCIRAFANTYLGYMDDEFFGFSVPEENKNYWLMDAKQAVDYYKDKLFFQNPVLEYDTFIKKPEFKLYLNALKMVKDNNE